MSDDDLLPIEFDCEDCGRRLSFPASASGRVEVCPHCAAYVDVPEDDRRTSRLSVPVDCTDADLPTPLVFDDDGFPRPRWSEFNELVFNHVPREQWNDVYCRAARLWMRVLLLRLPDRYSGAESEDFLVICPAEPDAAQRFAAFCQNCLTEIQSLLSKAVGAEGYGKFVVLSFAEQPRYWEYISAFYPDGEYGDSVGVCLRGDYQHVALVHARWEWRRTVVHELTHCVLGALNLPLWVEEGITQVLEDRILGESTFNPTPELRREHREHWGRDSLEGFWEGNAFSSPDGDTQRLAYSLAEILVRILLRDHSPRFFGFLQAATWEDAGNAAAGEVLGAGLTEILAGFLGPGEWYRPLQQNQ